MKHFSYSRFRFLGPILILSAVLQSANADEVLINGLAWRQLTDTAGAGLSWNDVASVCPLDETPCSGSVNGVDFTGWTWASEDRVSGLLNLLTGLELPAPSLPIDSPIEVFFDKFDPAFENETATLSYGLFALAEIPADSMVDVLELRDAHSTSASDRAIFEAVSVTDTEINFFGPQQFGVYLVRDPNIELCSNGIDDNGDGQVDIDDAACEATNPVINDLEWRQITATAGIGIRDVAAICPGDGTPCAGSAGGASFDGWTWANSVEVVDIISTLTDYEIGNTTDTFPGNSNELAAVFTKFNATLFSGGGRRTFFAYTSNSSGELGNGDYPDISFFVDPFTCLNNIDDDGDGSIDLADVHCQSSEWFVFSDGAEAADIDSMGTQGGGSLQNDFRGYFLYRAPLLVTSESCDNTLDDDGDGLIDGQDVDDCGPSNIDVLSISCIHDPIYADGTGGLLTISAQVVDALDEPIDADSVEIWIDSDRDNPQLVINSASEATYTFTPTDHFSYNCRAIKGEDSASTGWRRVTIGDFESDWPAIPILVHGAVADKVDIVFIADVDEYSDPAWDDPDFVEDVGLLIRGGFLTVPWFNRNQSYFNFWLGKDRGNSGPDPEDTDPSDGTSCLREGPDDFDRDYAFADAGAIVHRTACRDNAGDGLFTIELDMKRLQVLAHEMGHRPFGLSDEYCCDGGYWARIALAEPPFHNMFATESDCRRGADDRGKDPDACRDLIENGTDEDWWLYEPVKIDLDPRQRDLMQGTGCDILNRNSPDCQRIEPDATGFVDDPNGAFACASSLDTYVGDPDGIANNGDETYWICRSAGGAPIAVWESLGEPPVTFDRIDRGESEDTRLRWFLYECDAERC